MTNPLDPYKVDFFHDFILFLKYLDKQPIKRTLTGAISLSSDIKTLGWDSSPR